MPQLGEVVALLDRWYPPETADSWDAVGLVAGDPDQPVRRIHLAVDPTLAVAREAVARKADLLLTHHPLFLTPVHGVAATTPKGRTLTTLTGAGCALMTAHTNADQAAGGVSEALATTLGLRDQRPVRPAAPQPGERLDRLTVFVPADAAEILRVALTDAGAGRLGDYDSCTYSTAGQGRFRPLAGADPRVGQVGRLEVVDELRVETLVPRARRSAVVAALLAAHPYEEPAWDLVELVDRPLATGTGRVGEIEPTTLRDVAERVRAALPETAHGVRVSGDPDRVCRRVAVCGGAGDFLLDDVRALAADVYVTSDLRHHPASEAREQAGAPALVDVAHWAGEWTWLPVLAERLGGALGDTVDVAVSTLATDPWDFRP